MPDQNTYIFPAKDGSQLSFVGERPPTPEEISQLGGIAPESAKPSKPSTASGMELKAGTSAVAAASSAAAKGLDAFAASQTAAKTGGKIARNLTHLAALGKGVYTADPTQILAASQEAWAAGKGGYWLTKGAQSAASPIARALRGVGSAAETVSKVVPVQNALDLAQMAEPNRRDIGFLGVGASPRRIDPDALLKSQAATLDRMGVKGEAKRKSLEATRNQLIAAGYTFGRDLALPSEKDNP